MTLPSTPVLVALGIATAMGATALAVHPLNIGRETDEWPTPETGLSASEDSVPHSHVASDHGPGRPADEPDLRHEPPFPLEKGDRPSRDEALDSTNRYSRFIAKGDEGLEKLRAEGHLQGDGTREAPYILEDFYVEDLLSIESTHRSIILRNGYVEGQLKLNYIGSQVYVHHVYAEDLRVNENIKRNGTNTGGLFHDNHFAFVGQIRHFIGEFRDNTVGPRPANSWNEFLGDTGLLKVGDGVAFNFDGFHGADVHDNRFIGQVDIKLHGHNHADCFECPVHDHADATGFPMDEEGRERATGTAWASHHSVRYVSLLFRDNTIEVEGGVALRYNDRNHAGDDRTANSEPNPFLSDDHIHYQDITFRGNRLVGGGFLLDVFNAADDHHPTQNLGVLRIVENEIAAAPPTYATQPGPGIPRDIQWEGMVLAHADGVELWVAGNRISFLEPDEGPLAAPLGSEVLRTGILLATFGAANVTIEGNEVAEGEYGLFARQLAPDVNWKLLSNDFRTETRWRGSDIGNAPEEEWP